MAIAFKKDNKITYRLTSGLATKSDRQKAKKLYKELGVSIKRLEEELIEKGFLTEKGKKKDALRVWFEFGRLLNHIGGKYEIFGSQDEKLFWESIYGFVSSRVQKKPMPKRSRKRKQNHFYICALMARLGWQKVNRVGNWAIWRDIFDNRRLLEDERVFKWTADKIIDLRKSGLGHKQIRQYLYAISRRLKNVETDVLSNKELRRKLQKVKF